MTGEVVQFDGHTGLGAVKSDDGTRLPFHCTQVIGGSRSLEIGTLVRFEVVPGGLGVWEAGELEPINP